MLAFFFFSSSVGAFSAVRSKAAGFLTRKSLQDVLFTAPVFKETSDDELWDFISWLLILKRKKNKEGGEGPTVYSCYKIRK